MGELMRPCLIVTMLLGSVSCTDWEAQQTRVDSFVTAWAAGRYAEMWAAMIPYYRKDMPVEKFTREMAEHPFLPPVIGGVFVHDYARKYEGRLRTKGGEIAITLELYKPYRGPDEWFVKENVIADYGRRRYMVLPSRHEQLARAHAFLRDLVARRWAAAWKQTHPHYRSQVDEAAFAQALAKNVWLVAATGFRLSADEHPDQLLLTKGTVDVDIHFGEYQGRRWVSEALIGGTPTLPKPATPPRVRLEAE